MQCSPRQCSAVPGSAVQSQAVSGDSGATKQSQAQARENNAVSGDSGATKQSQAQAMPGQARPGQGGQCDAAGSRRQCNTAVSANSDVGDLTARSIAGLRKSGLCEEADHFEAIMAELQHHKQDAEKHKRRAEAFKAAAEEIKRDAVKYKRKAETFQTRAVEILQNKLQKLNTVLVTLDRLGGVVPQPAPEPAVQPHNPTGACSSSHHSTQRQYPPVSTASQGRRQGTGQELGSASSTILHPDITVEMIRWQSV